jgi:hypothetical protein
MTTDLNDACRSFAHTFSDGFDRIAAIYRFMDLAYKAVAGHYGFICSGCEDNCCRTRFRHHTLVEYAYLQKGFEGLDRGRRREVVVRARDYRLALQAAESANTPFRHWCPLSHEGRCILYAFRPMICRLHGLPHHLRHPARGLIQGSGCHIFEMQRPAVAARSLDRSELYKSLAGLEQAARQITGFSVPIGMTVADMILADTSSRRADRPADNP